MKHLIVYNHIGDKLLDLEVFVDGQDFTFKAPRPTALWLGKICLLDKELEPEQPTMESVIGTPMFEVAVEKEETHESETTDNQSDGDSRSSQAIESASIEAISEEPAGRELTKGSKRTRKSKTT